MLLIVLSFNGAVLPDSIVLTMFSAPDKAACIKGLSKHII